MIEIEPLDQIRSNGAQALDRTSKLQKKSESRNSILGHLRHFAASVPDFRRTGKGNIRHRLSDMLALIIFARMSKCVGRAEIIAFGERNLGKFHKMGMLLRGVPSEATLCRVSQGIDELKLEEEMRKLMDLFQQDKPKARPDPDVVCIDGKAMRGTVQQNGRSPDVVSAYSPASGITLATEACQEKSNEITAVPKLLDKLDIEGRIITADAMSMQKAIIDKIREKKADFVIELKANQRSLRYGIEDRLKGAIPVSVHAEGPALGHGRIETRTYRVYDGLGLIADRKKWGGGLSVISFESETVVKSTGELKTERRLYISSLSPGTPRMGSLIRRHWMIESMHWSLDCNLLQDRIKRKTARAARNLDTIQRIVLSLFSIWRNRRRKLSDKAKGTAELMRTLAMSFANLKRFMAQK